ncbi:hypothetical protein HPC49_16025 [Pyxidicoccus fallax]|uniref:Lipoprotein n=1 Tax=Pyxidicoccus fallax TaxID=394095 RepID=A0A848LFE4_9BACT|nr:hypothetical protein [Pyxidicoccus fallax]NMO15733.1 hypothetical protein [Pyxidicoccus fallax]NPC79727.1 hypothetical protein [Pyxidicoccus fallax]
MQLRKMMLVLTALGAMSGFMAGCGDDNEGGATCTTNDDCNTETEICHPTAGVCVQTCTDVSECPESARGSCAAVGGTGPDAATRVCKCSTDELCNGGSDAETSDLVCSDLDTVCVPKCGSDADCGSGRVCDVASGQCEEEDTGPATCSGEAQSTCAYGEFCSSGSCAEVPAPTCPNLSGKPAANFDPATGTGNIIYNVTKEIFGGACGSDTTAQTVKARVSFYSKSGTLPTTKEGLNGFFYVRTNGSELNGVPLSNGYQRSSDGRSASLSVNLCTSASDSQIVLGFYFTGGNGYCATLTK